ncbi:MAG TPA: NnrU family protein, partial [Parafilimonas sp.]|nr:NnrU family protein [Parafilimonas sp.]
MTKSHIILTLLWVIFSVLHSLFANEKWKKKMQVVLKKNYKFYRIAYSFFALITLAIVVTYNFLMQSFLLWNVNIVEQVIAVACMLTCGTIMLLFTR